MTKKRRVAEMKRLRDKKLMTLREIGERFDISRERVRQLIGNTGHLGKVDALRKDLPILRDRVYYDESTTVAKIAAKYRLAEVTVRKELGPRWKYLLSLGMRKCYRCHHIKSVDEFGVSNSRYKKFNISGICKECNNAGARHYYQVKKSQRQ